jgi:Fe-S-cluster containining protein
VTAQGAQALEESTVPCGSCRLCCSHEAIILDPRLGDLVTTYETRVVVNPLDGELAAQVLQKPNGDCIYLDETGCTIYERRPAICRVFDCRKFALKFDRPERRRLSKEPHTKAVIQRGMELKDTL